jgi:diadenosine tetraphosphate (Ap4A) HIT family hydrolase
MSGATAIHRRVAALHAGTDPTLVARLNSGWAVLGEQQFLRGYCLLLPDPVAPDLNALDAGARLRCLADATLLGDALLAVTGALRINYAIFGNQEPALHIHVVPRYRDEAPALRTAHPWAYDWSAAPRFDAARDAPLVLALRQQLEHTRKRLD